MPVPIRISNVGSNISGGLVTALDFPLASDTVLVTEANQANITGGVLPMDINEYGKEAGSLVFDFVSAKINPIVGSGTTSVSTSANGTYVNSAGLITQNTANQPRFDYLGNPGLLIEPAAINLCLQSETLGTTWTVTRASVSSNQIAAPTGATTADKLVEDTTATNSHFIQQAFTKAASALAYEYTIFAKAGERTFFRIQTLDGLGNGAFADVNLSTGTITGASGIGGTPFTALSSEIVNYGNGWFRAVLGFTTGTDTSLSVFNVLANALAGVSYTGDGTSGAYFWGGQLEQTTYYTSYIPTTTVAVTRAADAITLAGTLSTEGTMFVEFVAGPAQTTAPIVYGIDDGTNNERAQIFLSSGNDPSLFVVDGGVTQVNAASSSAVTQNAVSRVAYRYKLNDFGISTNGAAVGTDTSGTLPTVTTRRFGAGTGSTQYLLGKIRRVAEFPVAYQDSIIRSMST